MNCATISIATTCLVLSAAACGTTLPDGTGGQAGTGVVGTGNAGMASTGNAGTGQVGNMGGTTTTGGGTVPVGNAGTAPVGNAGTAPVGNAGTAPVGDAGGATAGGATATGSAGGPSGGGTSAAGTNGAGASSGGATSVVEPTLITSKEGTYWQLGELTPGGTAATVTVNDTDTHQTWHGFGGTFNEKGWDALQALSEADRALAIRLLFDANEGAAFSWGRIPIGASDYATDRYTCNDTAGDLDMVNFSIARDQTKLIPYIHAAQAVKSDIKFFASPWTPPPWMKDNNAYDKGLMNSTEPYLSAYAQYLVKFVQAYGEENIPIDHVHPQNEPGWAQAYPSCAWGPTKADQVPATTDAPFMGTFVEMYLAPALSDAGLTTKVWYGTLSNNDTFEAYWGNLTPTGRGLIGGVALQWGTRPRVETILASNPELLVMQSEHKCGNYPWLAPDHVASSVENANRDNFLASQAPNNYAYGEETWDLIKDWISGGVHMYSAWNMVLDTGGFSLDESRPWPQNALLVVDTAAGQLTLTPAYYVFRHVAQYVEPGAVRVGVDGDALAFKNPDGSIVTIIHNTTAEDRPTTLSVGGTLYQFTLPGGGFATANWQP